MRFSLGLMAAVAACGTTKNADVPVGDACTRHPDWSAHPLCTAWVINTDARSTQITDETGQGVLTDVQSVFLEQIDGDAYMRVQTSGVPSYQITMIEADVTALNDRPLASDDFADGATTAAAGDVIEFGQDIGYENPNCDLGYWPPGPECAADAGGDSTFPMVPERADHTDCATGAGVLGRWVSGVAIYGWTDTSSYNNEGSWNNIAIALEYYDIDVCGGHAGFGGEYHHHGQSECLRALVGDAGTEHSPIWGFAGDGYPVYGPWHAADVLAETCWKARAYTADSPTGCGEDHKRSCVMVDPYDPAQGTEPADNDGPDDNTTVTSMSGNTFDAVSGLYFEDHYFDPDCPAEGAQYLDAHNGHDHDGLGYHYHVTVTLTDAGRFLDKFPMHIGPSYAGELPDGATSTCGDAAGDLPPDDGPPPDGGPPPGAL